MKSKSERAWVILFGGAGIAAAGMFLVTMNQVDTILYFLASWLGFGMTMLGGTLMMFAMCLSWKIEIEEAKKDD